MRNKILLATIIIVVSIIIATALNFKEIKRAYILYTSDFSAGTGVISTTPSPEVIEEGKLISALRKELPISKPAFRIERYDYATGKFVVVSLTDKINLQKEFDIWQSTSSYSAIPTRMFLLQY